MERKNKKRRRIRPVYVGFFGTLMTAAIIFNLVYALYYSYDARKLVEEEKARVLNQTVSYTDRYMKEVENGANTLFLTSAVQKLMSYRLSKNYLDYVSCMELLSDYAMLLPDIYRIDLYVYPSRTLVTSSEGVFYDLSEEERRIYDDYMQSEEKDWFWDMSYQGKEPKLVSATRNEKYISFIKPVVSRYTGKKMGILCISVELSELEKLIPEMAFESEEMCLSYEGQTILGKKPAQSGFQAISRVSDYSGMVFDYYYIPRTSELWNSRFTMPILLIMALFAVIFLMIVRVSERKMFNPVNTLLEGFGEVEQGKFHVRLDTNRDDLFQELFRGFNHMAETLERMIEELSNERTRRNELKFRLLQMQIKPHFLYNLFNNMVWMMEQKDYGRLEDLIQSTAGYYKTALNYGNRDIMLIDNKKQLEYYAEIQKIRFGNRFTFQVTFPEEVQFYSIPNLLLQPLAENSIVHGLKGKEDICHIEVRAETEEDTLILTVEDDGCGIEPEELKSIRKELENYEEDGSKYFALANIAARLHNRYKEQTALTINSQPGNGTTVTIKVPLSEVRSCIV